MLEHDMVHVPAELLDGVHTPHSAHEDDSGLPCLLAHGLHHDAGALLPCQTVLPIAIHS